MDLIKEEFGEKIDIDDNLLPLFFVWY